jgi:hypothetical protein
LAESILENWFDKNPISKDAIRYRFLRERDIDEIEKGVDFIFRDDKNMTIHVDNLSEDFLAKFERVGGV